MKLPGWSHSVQAWMAVKKRTEASVKEMYMVIYDVDKLVCLNSDTSVGRREYLMIVWWRAWFA